MASLPEPLTKALAGRPCTGAIASAILEQWPEHRLIEDAGFSIEHEEYSATQGRPIDKAVGDRVSVSAAFIVRAT